MNIGILGSGNVGGTLGSRWSAGGHNVKYGTRVPGSVAEAIANSDVVVLATPWPATREVVEGAAASLKGKIVIDATNPLLPNLAGIEYGTTTSGAEQIAAWAPGARVVKAFNTIGFNVMADPRFGDRAASLLYCGDDAEGKKVAHQLALELGFAPHDAGPLTQARVLEPFALLWISLAVFHGYGREIAFDLMKRGA